MSRKTCRNGLVWQGRRARFIFVAAIGLGLMATPARGGSGGSLDSPAAPTDPASAMFTLNDIYNKLDMRSNVVAKRPGAFTEPTAGPTGTMHALNAIMTLVTNRAPVPKTGQKISYRTGDDGWYSTNFGVAWPVPRFTTNNIMAAAGTNVVTDNLTGLMWTRNAALASANWTNAISYCYNMNTNIGGTYGYTDWRLPNWNEMLSLGDVSQLDASALPAGHPFNNFSGSGYWLSTWYIDANGLRTYIPADLGDGGKASTYNVWPVRGGGY